MKEILNHINTLRQLSGNAQLEYLRYSQSDQLKQVLLYTYDPHRKYKMDEKLNKFRSNTYTDKIVSNIDWIKFTELLDYLSNKPSATDEDAKKVSDFIASFSVDSQDLLVQVLMKDLRINMGVKKFQKIWPDFCVEPQVQLAQSKADRDDFINGVYSRKFDGKRMYIMEGKPYSRANNLCYVNPVQHILEQVNQLVGEADVILDGECLYFENGKENFQKGISLCQSEERKEGCDNICYVIFDVISKNNFLTKTPEISFKHEYKIMLESFADETKPTPDYSLIPTKVPNVFIARQDSDPTRLMKLRRENNWEGLMYRNADASYEYKRSSNLLKIKAMKDIELKLIGMEEGTGRNEGRLGAFIVEYKDSKVKVGSGFADEMRDRYWNNKDKYIGQFVKVQYFEETKNQDGTDSLRFPVFLSFRNIQTNEEFI